MINLQTSMGTIKVVLHFHDAPKSCANFLTYARNGFYNNTLFHRVIDGFMIQGGGFEPGMVKKPTKGPIINEADRISYNQRGSLAFARTAHPHSTTSQFFINLVDNHFLDHTSKTPTGWGYCTFGRVVDGMDTVDKIRKCQTAAKLGHQDVPIIDILIESILLDEKAIKQAESKKEETMMA